MAPKVNKMLIPNVSKLPGQQKVDNGNKLEKGKSSEFRGLFDDKIGDGAQEAGASHGIKLSMHAARRLNERNFHMDNKEFFKLKNAMEKLKSKGGQDSLIITGNAAYIVDVKNNTIVTAIDKASIKENVFTKIDSTVFVD